MFPIRTSVPNREIPGTVIALIAVNLAVFFVQAGMPAGTAEDFMMAFALVPARFEAAGWSPWPVLTNIFMHAGIFHLVLNMWTLWLFGRALEDAFGPPRFLAFYLSCGAVASLAHLLFNLGSDIPALGASGAIAGVLGGFTLLHPKARITLVTPILVFPIFYSLPAAVFTALWFALQLIPGLIELQDGPPRAGIAWWAHIGGLMAGLGLAALISRSRTVTRFRPGRLTVSVEAGHRPQIISVGGARGDEAIAGVQRPSVIRLGGPRVRQTERRAPPPEIPLANAAPEKPAPRPARRSRQSSSVPITHNDTQAPVARAPASDAPAMDVWRRG